MRRGKPRGREYRSNELPLLPKVPNGKIDISGFLSHDSIILPKKGPLVSSDPRVIAISPLYAPFILLLMELSSDRDQTPGARPRRIPVEHYNLYCQRGTVSMIRELAARKFCFAFFVTSSHLLDGRLDTSKQ